MSQEEGVKGKGQGGKWQDQDQGRTRHGGAWLLGGSKVLYLIGRA